MFDFQFICSVHIAMGVNDLPDLDTTHHCNDNLTI